MARILITYGCENAMQLDMNAYMYLHNAIFEFDRNGNIHMISALRNGYPRAERTSLYNG